MEYTIFSDCEVCEKCKTETGTSTGEILKISFTSNPCYEGSKNPAMPKYSFRLGAYCSDCGAWKKWKKQTVDLIMEINKSILVKE